MSINANIPLALKSLESSVKDLEPVCVNNAVIIVVVMTFWSLMTRQIHYYYMHINILVTITNTLSISTENIYKLFRL